MTLNPRPVAGLLLLLFAAMELFMRRGRAARSLRAGPADRGTSLVIVLCYALAITALWWPAPPGPRLPPWAAWPGIAIAVAGTALRLWSMASLGELYTRTLSVVAGQQVVRRGPYRRIRHPGYLSSLLIWGGAAAASGSVLALLVVAALLLAAYAYRIQAEEAMLVGALGRDYQDYQGETWRLIPFVY